MTTDWNEVLERLLSLQQLDSKISLLEAELRRAPGELAGRRQAVAEIEGRIKQVADRTKVLRAQILLRENELKTHERKIAKLKDQAGEVRTNKEFMAFRSEIANAQGDCDRLQNEVLKILDVVEQADAKVAEFEVEKDHELEAAARAQAEIDEKLADVRAELQGLRKDRPAQLVDIPKEQLEVYERALRARGRGLAPLEGAYCGHCGDVQTRNDVYAVQNRTRPVLCTGCNVLLYLP